MRRYSNRSVKGTVLVICILAVLAANTGMVAANGSSHGITFPEWTYYAEIFEHSAMIIIAVVALLFLIRSYRTHKEAKQGILWMIIGLAVFAFAQLLTNMHHFLIYPFGIWNAIIHHGLYVVSIIIIVFAFFKVLKYRR